MTQPRIGDAASTDTAQAPQARRVLVSWNNEPRSLPAGLTIGEAIEAAGVRLWVYMVELNGELVRHEQFGEVCLDEGDIVELVHMPYGG